VATFAAQSSAAKYTARIFPISRAQAAVKRAVDVIVAAIALLLFSPVLALIALLIKLQDGGPVIHRRRVVGPGGEFDAFKLRSMCLGADAVLQRDPHLRAEFEQNFKLRSDPRVTRVGRVIRRLSLDELPQLVNVLNGQMSLVGPRMVTPEELEKFGDARWIFRVVKPGLTGYWQVYRTQQLSYSKRVEMEVFYVKNWSLILDLKILAKTPFRMARGSGAD
jgi:lipopolysaccharide/colanic/teichoic acid biosynthesis glycosyltransferase